MQQQWIEARSARILALRHFYLERKQGEEVLREPAQGLELAVTSGKRGNGSLTCLDGVLIWDDQLFVIDGVDRVVFSPYPVALRPVGTQEKPHAVCSTPAGGSERG